MKLGILLHFSAAVLVAGTILGGLGAGCTKDDGGECSEAEAEGADCSCGEDDLYAPDCVDGEWECSPCT